MLEIIGPNYRSGKRALELEDFIMQYDVIVLTSEKELAPGTTGVKLFRMLQANGHDRANVSCERRKARRDLVQCIGNLVTYIIGRDLYQGFISTNGIHTSADI